MIRPSECLTRQNAPMSPEHTIIGNRVFLRATDIELYNRISRHIKALGVGHWISGNDIMPSDPRTEWTFQDIITARSRSIMMKSVATWPRWFSEAAARGLNFQIGPPKLNTAVH